MNTAELIAEAMALPVEARVLVAESLLQSLNAPDAAMDSLWATEAQRRFEQLRRGEVVSISGPAVFERLMERFGA